MINVKSNKLGSKIKRLCKEIGESCHISLICDYKKNIYMLADVKTLRAYKFEKRLEYDGSEDFDNDKNDKLITKNKHKTRLGYVG